MAKLALEIFKCYRFNEAETLERLAEEDLDNIDPCDQPERAFAGFLHREIRRLHGPAKEPQK